MSGLFSKEVLETQAQVAISNLEPECFKCGLYRYVNTPRMKVSGKGKKKILIVAEANGGDEDRYGTQLVGKTGQFYRKQLAKVGIDLDDDCWKINSVNCRPYTKKGNRKPTKDEIVFCRPMVEKALRELKPEFIWLLGGVALSSFFAKEFSQLQVERWRGLCIPDEKWNAYVLPMYHPSFAMRKERSKNVQSSFMHDLKYAVSCLNKKPFNVHAIRASDIRILTDYHSILSVLDNIIKIEPEFFFFDYETTGKHPFRPGHKIVSMSFAINSQEGVSFPYNHTSIFTTKEKIEMRKRWSSILLNPRIKKTAHNIQFENLWSSVILKTKPVNWHWCTMLTSRCLDNRRGGAGLKYQVYKNFGIRPYDKEIAPYIKGNPFNKIEKAPLKLLLEYGGKDSLYGFRLFEKQREELPDSVENGRQLLTESSIVFSEDTETGMVIDEEYFQKTRDDLLKRIAQMELNLEESKEAQEFKRIHNRLPSFSSNPDMGLLFYEIMKVPPIYTDKEQYSVDKTALDKIDSPIAHDLIELRKIEKVESTYLSGFMNVATNGVIHPSFTHAIAVTIRSSSSNPNLQNVPIREEEARALIRKGLKAHLGFSLLEWDYSGIEVYTGCFYHHDKNMIKYLLDPASDMHRDTACDIWLLTENQVTHDIRHSGKNGWVFPQFYDSYYRSCARNLWDNFMPTKEMNLPDGTPMREHMRQKGIITYRQFEDHCEAVENIFWGERFFEYSEWKKDINKFYRKHGYIETLFGFKLTGMMEEKEVANYPIQGTAHHILVWSRNRLREEQKKRKWKTQGCGNVHDSGLAHVWPDEEEEVINTILDIATIEVRDAHKWITMPLEVDIEMTPINGSWYEKEQIELEEGT